MNSIEYDVNKAIDIIMDCEPKSSYFEKYDHIYAGSNEYLNEFFYHIKVTNKDVLTVCSSGDHALYSINSGARNVDLFDINCLTKYYYVLRLWFIKYFQIYSLIKLDLYSYIKKLLECVCPKNDIEKECYEFWSLFIKLANKNKVYKLFNYGRPNNIIDNLETISSFSNYNDFSFYNVDISKNTDSICKKYDVIFLSNIHEYVNIINLCMFRDNIYKLLNDDGIAVMSIFMNFPDERREILEESFEVMDIPEYNYFEEYDCSVGYVLKKRRKINERCK